MTARLAVTVLAFLLGSAPVLAQETAADIVRQLTAAPLPPAQAARALPVQDAGAEMTATDIVDQLTAPPPGGRVAAPSRLSRPRVAVRRVIPRVVARAARPASEPVRQAAADIAWIDPLDRVGGGNRSGTASPGSVGAQTHGPGGQTAGGGWH